MEAQKGHEVLLEALARPELRQVPLLFYLAGEGPLLEAHKALANRLGLGSRVVFGGFRRDVPRLYKGADAFLLSSHWESLPLSIREAMVAGLPVVSTNVAGVPEAVEHEGSGLLVPPGDSAALALAIAGLAGSAELRERMARRGREISDGKFNYDRWISATAETMNAIAEAFASRAKAS
jgi:glycosyltransferase involved in cell wall biosynthesis